ncbi:MAG: LLM class flavin-dependent oxidoreductase, partial [Pseudomonadota bacterium]
HAVNANLAMVSNFSVHADRDEAIARGQEGFEFFGYALNALVARDTVPGRTNLWGEYLAGRGERTRGQAATSEIAGERASGIGTPDDMRRHLAAFQEAGVDQVIFLQQAGRNRHDHICEALTLFAAEVAPPFWAEAAAREARKAEDLGPHIAAAMVRKRWMRPLADADIPIVRASVAKARINQAGG